MPSSVAKMTRTALPLLVAAVVVLLLPGAQATHAVECGGSVDELGARVHSLLSGGDKAGLLDVMQCISPVALQGSPTFSWSYALEHFRGDTALGECTRLIEVMTAAARRWEGLQQQVGQDEWNVFRAWFKEVPAGTFSSEDEARFEGHFRACRDQFKGRLPSKVYLTHEAASKAHNAGLAEVCAKLREVTTVEKGVQHLRELVQKPQEAFEKGYRGFFGCLVPVVRGGSFSWEAGVDAPKEEAAAMCDKYSAIIDGFAEPYLAREEFVRSSTFDVFKWVAEREFGKKFQGGFLVDHVSFYQDACTPKRPLETMGSSVRPQPGSVFGVKMSVAPNLPTSRDGYTALRVEAFCHHGAQESSGVAHLEHSRYRPSETQLRVGLDPWKRMDGIACVIVNQAARSYCVRGRWTYCSLDGFVRRTLHGKPHLVFTESSVSHCPYEWVSEVDATGQPHAHARRRPEYAITAEGDPLDTANCRGKL